MLDRKCIHEQIVTTSKPSYARVYLENILFENAGFAIGQKFTYYLDFKNKKVTIVPLKEVTTVTSFLCKFIKSY